MAHIFGIWTLSTSELRPYSCHDRLPPELLPVPVDGVDELEFDSPAPETGDVTVTADCWFETEDKVTGRMAFHPCSGL